MTEVAELMLPRVVPDTHCDTREAALQEAGRRATGKAAGAVTRIRKSSYGGYIVSSVPPNALARAVRKSGGRISVGGEVRYWEGYAE